jgi:hypothetical protein
MFLLENPKERNQGVGGRIILKWVFKKQDVSVDWIHLAQDRDKWQAFVNTTMNLHNNREVE